MKARAKKCPCGAMYYEEDTCGYGCMMCQILGEDCPRNTETAGSVENMKCCLPEYAAKRPEEKLYDETLAAIAGMTGCLECDLLGKHWYLSECDQYGCGSVDVHLKCYYLAKKFKDKERRQGR